MAKTKLSLLFALILMLSIASASIPTLTPIKQNTCADLPQSCITCTYNKITSIRFPNGTEDITELAMTKVGTNYKYNFCDTEQLGNYIVNGKGDIDGVVTRWNYNFIVTTDGQEVNSGIKTFVIFISLSIIILILGFVFHNYVFSFIAGLALSLTGVYSMIYGFGNSGPEYTRMMSYIIIGLGSIITMVSGFEWFKEIEEGSPNYSEEDND